MYIAGLNLAISCPQVLEALVVFSSFDSLRHLKNRMKTIAVQAQFDGGGIRAETTPVLGRIATFIHAITIHIPPIVYVGAIVLNKLRQPEWMTRFALPDEIAGVPLDPLSKGALRVGACVAGFALKKAIDITLYHLGDQWHFLGRRERPRVVQTGPYAWVRHPLYTTALLQGALWTIMFWSYVPLAALGATAAAFAIKMPIEEAMIERDDGIKEEYRDYKKKVPARIIPYIW